MGTQNTGDISRSELLARRVATAAGHRYDNSLDLLGRSRQMDPDVKKKWVGALRSGLFDQTRTVLRRTEVSDFGQRTEESNVGGYAETESFCCLGVLAELDTKVERQGPGYNFPGTPTGTNLEKVYNARSLPGLYAERLNLSDNAVSELARLNDAGCPFDLIADIIDFYL